MSCTEVSPSSQPQWSWLVSAARSSPSAAAASRWRAATRCSTTTSSRLTGKPRPRVCFLPSASGDADHYIVRFYRAFAGARAEASHISLFRRHRSALDLREHLLSQDLIYVGGGSLVSMLGVWRAHGHRRGSCAEAWEQRHRPLRPQRRRALLVHRCAQRIQRRRHSASRGIGLLPWSFTAHYDAEPERREELPAPAVAGHAAGLRGRRRRRPALPRPLPERSGRLSARGRGSLAAAGRRRDRGGAAGG